MVIYLIGSLRSPRVPEVAAILRDRGYEVFDDWYAAGPEADDYWQRYEKERGHTFAQALDGYPAYHVYNYDRFHIDRSDVGVLVLPAGKSGHLELGYLMGTGKPGFILLQDEPERFDVMYRFAKGVYTKTEDLLAGLERERNTSKTADGQGSVHTLPDMYAGYGGVPHGHNVPEVRSSEPDGSDEDVFAEHVRRRMNW